MNLQRDLRCYYNQHYLYSHLRDTLKKKRTTRGARNPFELTKKDAKNNNTLKKTTGWSHIERLVYQTSQQLHKPRPLQQTTLSPLPKIKNGQEFRAETQDWR